MINFETKDVKSFGAISLPGVFVQADKILQRLADNRVFQGGALRDYFMGVAHNDLDCKAKLKDNPLTRRILQVARNLPEQGKFYYSSALDACFQQTIPNAKLSALFLYQDHLILRIGFASAHGRQEEMDVSVYLNDGKPDARKLVMASEAPISSFVVDSDNVLWAHPRAFQDVKAKKFRQLSGFNWHKQARSYMRSRKLIDRISDIGYVPNWKTVFPHYAVKAFDAASELFTGERVVENKLLKRWRNSQKVLAFN